MTFFFSLYIVADCDHSAAVDAAETRVYSSSVPDGFPRLTSWVDNIFTVNLHSGLLERWFI